MAYFSNGSEGMVLDAQCMDCRLGEESCPVALVHMLHNYEQVGNTLAMQVMNDLVNEAGICQLKPLIDKL